MKQNQWKNKGVLWLMVLFLCGAAGCGKGDTEGSEMLMKPTSTPAGEVTVAPIVTLSPKPVTFPVEINEATFPEQLLRKKALAADADGDAVLSEEEARTVTKLHLKKLADADAKDAMEDEPLPEYAVTDFVFDLEGIQYFTELSELTVNLLGGESFVEGGTEEDILVEARNFNRVYECTKLKTLSLYEVEIPSLELSGFSELKRLELNEMYHLETLSVGSHEKLSALWVSGCHNLETVDLSGAKSIKNLDLMESESLKEVMFGEANGKLETIQFNGLKRLCEVDVSCLESLKSLNLTDVALTGLDVSKNAALEQLCAEGLQLDTLDLRSNPKISYLINDSDSFKEIRLPETNNVTMLRWTNSVVTEFPVTNLNPETLTGIDIQGTAIKELDVSGYPNLEHLYYDEDVTEIMR